MLGSFQADWFGCNSKAKTVEMLAETCATDKQYAVKILKHVNGIYALAKLTAPPEPASSWAAESWQWAINMGITDGTRPTDKATREEVAAMISKAHKLQKGQGEVSK